MNYIHTLVMLAKFSLGISLIVGIHELGHMLCAKMFGMHVEQYMIGFPPKILSFKWGKTEYALGAIPLGGAVKIAGMVDESMDETHVDQPGKPWEFRSKSKSKQLLVILGGILFNLISAFLIYTAIFYMVGGRYLPKEEVNKYGIAPTELGVAVGLERGDKILKKDDRDFKSFSQLQTNLGGTLSYVVLRKGQKIRLTVSETAIAGMNKGEVLMLPLVPFTIRSVVPNSPAAIAGLQQGDNIIAVNDAPTPYIQDLKAALHACTARKVILRCEREGCVFTKQVALDSAGEMGIQLDLTLKQAYENYDLKKASIGSLYRIGDLIALQAKGLSRIATGKISPSQAITGPIGMVKIFGANSGFYSFWEVIALISVLIAFMNLLPIPALDGGHAMILLYEIVTRRNFPGSWRMGLQKIGMLILLFLVLFALFNDLYRLLG